MYNIVEVSIVVHCCHNLWLQVYQEEDGTLIDDDMIFVALCEEAKANQQKLCIMLLPFGTDWSSKDTSGGKWFTFKLCIIVISFSDFYTSCFKFQMHLLEYSK